MRFLHFAGPDRTLGLLTRHGSADATERLAGYIPPPPPPAAPAVTLVEVSKLYGPDFLIEIEAVAAV
jgi:hypothetical protein